MNDPVDLKQKYIKYFRDVPIQRYAAMYIGRDEDTIIRWRKDDAEFADCVESARAAWVKEKLKATLPSFALERVEKEIFTEKRQLEITTPTPIMELPNVSDNNSGQEDKNTDETD